MYVFIYNIYYTHMDTFSGYSFKFGNNLTVWPVTDTTF